MISTVSCAVEQENANGSGLKIVHTATTVDMRKRNESSNGDVTDTGTTGPRTYSLPGRIEHQYEYQNQIHVPHRASGRGEATRGQMKNEIIGKTEPTLFDSYMSRSLRL